MADRDRLIEDGRLIRQELLDFTAIDAECEKLTEEMDVVSGLVRKCVDENATQATDQVDYISRYNSLVERYEKLQARYDALQKNGRSRPLQRMRSQDACSHSENWIFWRSGYGRTFGTQPLTM